MNENLNQYIRLTETPINSILNEIVTDYTFVNIGVIKKLHNDIYADVVLYYLSDTGDEIVISDVRILQLGTAKCKVFIKPEVGDNVLILTPKDFVSELEFNRKPDEPPSASRFYSKRGTCGILIRPEKGAEEKLTIEIDENGSCDIVSTGGYFSVTDKDNNSVVSSDTGVKITSKEKTSIDLAQKITIQGKTGKIEVS